MKNIKTKLLAAAAVVCILTATIGPAYAYFSASASAAGKHIVRLGSNTNIEEPEIVEGVKHVVITNAEDAGPVFVRATAFAGGDVDLTYSGDKWTPEGGYYVYNDIVAGGESTTELLVSFRKEGDLEEGESYNVIVVYEATPVQYDENGNPYADWSLKSDSAEGGING